MLRWRFCPHSRAVLASCTVLGICVGTLGRSSRADACDCDVVHVPAELVRSDAAFSGEVTAVGERGSFTDATFRVARVWKGPRSATLRVITPERDAECGFPFRIGETYLVFADFLGGRAPMCEMPDAWLETGLCRVLAETAAAGLGDPVWTAPSRAFRRGDVNADAGFDVSDPIALLVHLFQGGEPARCADIMDLNDDAAVDLTDAVFGLNNLFLGGPRPPAPGPDAPGFDPTTDDPFACGDAALFPCPVASSSNLPGVRVEMVEGPCMLSLAEAAEGVRFTFRLVVAEEQAGVISTQLGTCQQPGPGGLLLFPRISGGEELYCLCDLGKCFRQDHEADLVAGSYAETFAWCGRNWVGPSDFSNPVGAPFPPGTYQFEVRGEGTWVNETGETLPFEVAASYDFELVP